MTRGFVKEVSRLDGHHQRACLLTFKGTDPQGEPFDSFEHPDLLDRPADDDAYAVVTFVSRRAEGAQPARPSIVQGPGPATRC